MGEQMRSTRQIHAFKCEVASHFYLGAVLPGLIFFDSNINGTGASEEMTEHRRKLCRR